MKTFLKTLIGGALGVGALYVVGKICYEAGKDVAEVERQLRENKPEEPGIQHVEQIQMDIPTVVLSQETVDKVNDGIQKEEESKPSMFSRMIDKVKNAKLFLTAKKAFDKSGKQPGILSSLLTNPDGARIEAFVQNGGVQISVKPRAA